MTDWSLALCAEIGGDLWVPDSGGNSNELKAVCFRCEIREACLDEALSLPTTEDLGIRGGMSAKERQALRRTRKAAA